MNSELGAISDGVGQIFLSPLEPGDEAVLHDWINDRGLVVLNAPFRPVPRAEHAEWFATVQRRADTVILAIRLDGGSQLIGTAQLHSIHTVHRTAELQIRIADPSHRGKGYGTSALGLLLDLAFDDLNLHRVQLYVFADNARAIRAYERVGFMREGLLRQAAYVAGSYVDLVVMGLLHQERPVVD